MIARLDNIGRYFPEVDLFRGVNLQINEGERIGLVGPNGSGKSQLLGILCGEVHADEGKVEWRSRLRIGKLAQEVRVDPERSVLEETLAVFEPLRALEGEIARLEESISACPDESAMKPLLARYSSAKDQYEREDGYGYRQRTAGVLLGLGFSEADQKIPCSRLSGGQLNRLGLARLLLQQADLLLLDEPTNHLDLGAVRWLEEFLQNWERSFVVVSHDRYFLNRVVRQTWEISNRRVLSWPGNYSQYLEAKRKRLDQQRREFERQQEFIGKTEDFIRRNIYGQKTKQAQSRRKMLEKLELIERPTDDQRQIRLDLSEVPRSPHTVLTLEQLVVGYGAPLVRFPFEMTIVGGERIGILGENGTGKTTLVRTLLGQLPPVMGNFGWGRGISVGYFDQKMDLLTGSPLQEIRLLDPLAAEGDLRSFLARFGFRDDDVFKPLSALSGGEKNRLLLARLIYGRHNVLVLDEPTNHLDVAAREELESALETYSGTVLVITHDRFFLDRIVQRIIWIKDGRADHFLGNYTEWETHLRNRPAESGVSSGVGSEPSARPSPGSAGRESGGDGGKPGSLSKNERFRYEAQLAEIEADIHRIESRQQAVVKLLENPAPGQNPGDFTRLGQEHQELENQLADLLARWETLGEKLAR